MSESDFRKAHVGGYSLWVREGLTAAWAAQALEDIARLPRRDYRLMGYVAMPEGHAFPWCFVKMYEYSPKPGRSRLKRLFDRFRSGEALREGRAYRRFARQNLAIPELVFYGEESGRGRHGRGIVAIERIQGPTLQEMLAADLRLELIEPALAELVRIHQAGFIHGDANFYNFLLRDGQAVVIDLVRSAPLSRKGQIKDLVDFLAKACLLFSSGEAVAALIRRYQDMGGKLPCAGTELQERAMNKAGRFAGTRWVKPDAV